MVLMRMIAEISGERFSPSSFCKKITIPFDVFLSHEPDEIDEESGENFGFGCISILNPIRIGVEYELIEYQEWYVDFIEMMDAVFKGCGGGEINLFIDIFYSGQCNLEILDRNFLGRVAKYNVALPISVYSLKNDELKELLRSEGYAQARIEEIFESES